MQQKLNAAMPLAGEAEGSHLYVCGPAGFTGHVLDTAKQQGWSDNSLRTVGGRVRVLCRIHRLVDGLANDRLSTRWGIKYLTMFDRRS